MKDMYRLPFSLMTHRQSTGSDADVHPGFWIDGVLQLVPDARSLWAEAAFGQLTGAFER